MTNRSQDNSQFIVLVDDVFNMLFVTDLLSSNLCSLRGGEERLAFSCVWEIDENANIIHTKFHKSVIKVSCIFLLFHGIPLIFRYLQKKTRTHSASRKHLQKWTVVFRIVHTLQISTALPVPLCALYTFKKQLYVVCVSSNLFLVNKNCLLNVLH